MILYFTSCKVNLHKFTGQPGRRPTMNVPDRIDLEPSFNLEQAHFNLTYDLNLLRSSYPKAVQFLEDWLPYYKAKCKKEIYIWDLSADDEMRLAIRVFEDMLENDHPPYDLITDPNFSSALTLCLIHPDKVNRLQNEFCLKIFELNKEELNDIFELINNLISLPNPEEYEKYYSKGKRI